MGRLGKNSFLVFIIITLAILEPTPTVARWTPPTLENTASGPTERNLLLLLTCDIRFKCNFTFASAIDDSSYTDVRQKQVSFVALFLGHIKLVFIQLINQLR